nr:hypothetical protein [Tanacetum cinerariifolium]
MSTQQDIYESRPPMLNKENYVLWSSRLLWYAKSRPNGKLIHNSILNGPYVRKMIPEPGDANHEITVTETFHLQTDDELSDKELKQIKADDQAIQTILLGLPEDIYAGVDSCETAQEIWLRVQQMMKGYESSKYDCKSWLLLKRITCSCFHGFIDKDLINLVIPDVRRYVVVLTGIYYHLKELRYCAQCLIEDEDFIKRSRSTLREEV